ncbi:hypothetical protein COU76_04480 [Candidatus Peregrinibacteria bacterium CG10_big_fil_rev_8_21_14_0_10_49_10]|nr:MAG: hypothetical protein COU76_04480 [Candidatus Peregrinibacteria bacterium CG10_big_fil_rev_8_21_14_0_10_49_10]
MSFHVRHIEEKSDTPPRWRKLVIGALEIGKPLIGWYGLWKERKEKEQQKKKRVMVLKRFLLILIAVLLGLVLFAQTVRSLTSIHLFSFGNIASFAGSELLQNENGTINLLLTGQGNEEHDGKDLTDTIMVASIDPTQTKSIVLLSLPRDVYLLSTEKMGKGKINSFYRDYKGYLRYQKGMEEQEAAVEALREIGNEIGRKLGMEINYTVKVNFTAFTEAVDALGGVDIVVPEDITDTEYPDENFGYETFTLEKGPQHLDGATALRYARSRHSSSDFSRSARQQQLLEAMGEKARGSGKLKDPDFITQMMHTLSENVETTMSVRELIGLAGLLRKMDTHRVVSFQLNDRNALYDSFIEPGGFLYTPPRSLFESMSVLLPVSRPEFPVTWRQPQAFVHLLQSARAVYLAKPTIHILNNGAPSGSAGKLATELIRYGFSVEKVANASLPKKQEQSVLFAGSPERDDLALFFSTLLGIDKDEKPVELPQNEVADITLILGEDYAYTPLQNLLPSS